MSKTISKDELLAKLFSGKKMKASAWENEKYIEVKAGQVVTDKGEPFNIIEERELNEWEEWVARDESEKLIVGKKEALIALYDGKSVRAIEWEENRTLSVHNGQILLNASTVFDITGAIEEEWVVVEEKNEDLTSLTVEILELKKLVHELIKGQGARDGRSVEGLVNTGEMVKSVYGVISPKEVQALFKERLESAESSRDIERTVVEFIPYCWIGGRTLGTVAVYYTNMRRVIKELEDDTYKELALALFLPPQSLYEASQKKVDDNKKEKIRNKNTFNPTHIKGLLEKIKEKLKNDDFSEKPRQTSIEREKAYWAYAYLTLTTGRRQAEILKSLSIVKNGDNWEYCGISKDRDGGKCIKAYALDDDFEFLSELLTYIQAHIGADKMTQKQINSKFNNSFNGALKRITNTSLTAKDWREIFTEMMWLKDGIKEGSSIDKRDFRAMVLGHDYDGRLSATEHYEGWEAKEEKGNRK